MNFRIAMRPLESLLAAAEKHGSVSVTFYAINVPPRGLVMIGRVETEAGARVFSTADALHEILTRLAGPTC